MFDRITWSNIELESVRLCDGDRMNIMLINIETSRLLIGINTVYIAVMINNVHKMIIIVTRTKNELIGK
jgi:hypothetical protein